MAINMSRIWADHRWSLIALGVLIVALMMSVYVVPEEEQVVIVRTGNPVGTVNTPDGTTQAGLYLRRPLIDRVVRVQQRLLVNAYARFRIVDPVRMVERAGSTEGVRVALEPILNSVLRQELGRRTFQAMLTAERGTALANVRANLDRQARQYGAEVVDVQIKRTDLPDAPLQSAFRRMESDREREARTIRAQGDRDARIIRAEADAEAARIYAEAYGKDPQFYDFYRAMQSYDTTFAQEEGEGQSSIILSPDNEYLRQFRGRR
jgi:membrane protease subunit HflC